MTFSFDCLSPKESPTHFTTSNYRKFDRILRDRLAAVSAGDFSSQGGEFPQESDDLDIPGSHGTQFPAHKAILRTYLLEYVYSPKNGVDTLDSLVVEYGLKSRKFQILVRDSFPFVCPECGAAEQVFPVEIDKTGFLYHTRCSNPECTNVRKERVGYPSDELMETLLDMDALRNAVANCNLRAIFREAGKAYSQLRFAEENGFDAALFMEFVSHGQVVLRKAMENYDPERSGTFWVSISSVSSSNGGIDVVLNRGIGKKELSVSVCGGEPFRARISDSAIRIPAEALGGMDPEEIVLSHGECLSFPSGWAKFITYLTNQLRFGMQKFGLSVTGIRYPVYKDVLSRKIHYGMMLRTRLVEEGIVPDVPLTMRWVAFFIHVSMKDFVTEKLPDGTVALSFPENAKRMSEAEKFGRTDPDAAKFDPDTEKALLSLERAAKKAILEYESYFQFSLDRPLWGGEDSGDVSTILDYAASSCSSIDVAKSAMNYSFAIRALIRKFTPYWITLSPAERMATVTYVEQFDESATSEEFQERYARERAAEIEAHGKMKSEKTRRRFPRGIVGRVEYVLETLAKMDAGSKTGRVAEYL